MNRAIDTLFWQWAITEDEKRIPTILEDIADMDDADKIDGMLLEYAHALANVIESEVASRAIVDMKVQEAGNDPELGGADEDLLAQAIFESEDVQEVNEAVDVARNNLDLLHTSIVKVFSREV